MSGNNAAPELVVPSPKTKPPLQTYSRRTLKRRLTISPTRVHMPMDLDSQTFPSTAPELTSGVDRSLGRETANSGRKRLRLSAPAAIGKTPTELFLEHMRTSSMLCQGKQEEEKGPGLGPQDGQTEEAAPLVADQDGGVAFNGDKPVEEGVEVMMRAHEPGVNFCDSPNAPADEEVKWSIEEADDSDDDGGKKSSSARIHARINAKIPRPADTDAHLNETAEASSTVRVKRYTLLSLSPPLDQRLKAKGRFLNATKPSPPAGFKAIRKVKSRLEIMGFDHVRRRTDKAFKVLKPTNDQPFKDIKHIGDGFTRDEAQPSPHRKNERRTRNTLNETHLKGLDLTQKGIATQEMKGPTWLRGQKKPRTATTASLWNKRQYLGSSQHQIESQDPLETVDVEDELGPEHSPRRGRSRHRSTHISDETEEVDLLIIPKASVEGVEQYISDADEPVMLLEFPKDEEEVELTTIPRTDTPEPENNDASSKTRFGSFGEGEVDNRLPVKRTWDFLDHDGDMMALRPDSRDWQHGVTRVLDTPRRKDAVGRLFHQV